MDRISVIIPAFNEEERIKDTISAVKSIGEVHEIIVVDDGSADKTAEAAESTGAKVVSHPGNRGKGQALQTGINSSTGTVIVFLDADTGTSAKEISKLIQPVKNHTCDMSIARFGSPGKKGGFGIVKKVSRFGTKLLCGHDVEAVLSGQRAFRAEVLQDLKIRKGYGAEVGMTVDILRQGYRFCEIDVEMTHRETGRDLRGFVHRGFQLLHIIKALVYCLAHI